MKNNKDHAIEAINICVSAFIKFIDEHSIAISNRYEKTYTIDDLRDYLPDFIESLKEG